MDSWPARKVGSGRAPSSLAAGTPLREGERAGCPESARSVQTLDAARCALAPRTREGPSYRPALAQRRCGGEPKHTEVLRSSDPARCFWPLLAKQKWYAPPGGRGTRQGRQKPNPRRRHKPPGCGAERPRQTNSASQAKNLACGAQRPQKQRCYSVGRCARLPSTSSSAIR